LYAEVVVQFIEVCRKFPKFLINYVENTILNPLEDKLRGHGQLEPCILETPLLTELNLLMVGWKNLMDS